MHIHKFLPLNDQMARVKTMHRLFATHRWNRCNRIISLELLGLFESQLSKTSSMQAI